MEFGKIGIWTSYRPIGEENAGEAARLAEDAATDLVARRLAAAARGRPDAGGDRAARRSAPRSSTSGPTSPRSSPPSTPSSRADFPSALRRHRGRPSGGDQRLHAAAERDARVPRRPRRGRRRRSRPSAAWPRWGRRCSTSPRERSAGTHPVLRPGRAHPAARERARRRAPAGARGRLRPRHRRRAGPGHRRGYASSTSACATTPTTCSASASARPTSPTVARTG